jgi:hypothetical protein
MWKGARILNNGKEIELDTGPTLKLYIIFNYIRLIGSICILCLLFGNICRLLCLEPLEARTTVYVQIGGFLLINGAFIWHILVVMFVDCYAFFVPISSLYFYSLFFV